MFLFYLPIKKILLGAVLALTPFSPTFAAHYEVTAPIILDALHETSGIPVIFPGEKLEFLARSTLFTATGSDHLGNARETYNTLEYLCLSAKRDEKYVNPSAWVLPFFPAQYDVWDEESNDWKTTLAQMSYMTEKRLFS